jgi:hypothetical protein
MRRNWFLILLLLLVTGLSAQAEQLFIRHTLYKGVLQGKGKGIEAELGPLVAALGFKLEVASGNWVVVREGESATLPEGTTTAGKVYFQGKAILSADGPNTMISVASVTEAVGAVFRVNKDLGCIDVSIPAHIMSSQTASTPRAHSQNSQSASSDFKVIAFDADW